MVVYQNVIEEYSQSTRHCGTGYAPAAEEAEAGGFYVQDQPVLQRDSKASLDNLYSFSKLKTKGHCDGSASKGVCLIPGTYGVKGQMDLPKLSSDDHMHAHKQQIKTFLN